MRTVAVITITALLAAGCMGGISSSPRDCPTGDPSDPIAVRIDEPDRFVGYCMELNSDTLHEGVLRKVAEDGSVHFPDQDPDTYYLAVRVQQRNDPLCADEASVAFAYDGSPVEVVAEPAVLCA